MILCVGTSPAVQHVVVAALGAGEGVVGAAGVGRWCAAGKSCNAAKVAQALGEEVCALTTVGGASGEMLRADLQRMGLRVEAVEVQRATRICSTIVEPQVGEATECVEETGAMSEGELLVFWARFNALLPSARALVLSGSLAPGVPVDFYARCVEAAHARGIVSLVDVQGAPLRAALGAHPTVIKPNRAELAATVGMGVGTEEELQAASAALVREGPRWAAITSGKDSALLSDGRQIWAFSPPRVRAVSPIGSGDAFAGAMAVALVRGMPMPQAMRLAIAAGSANAMQLLPGCVEPRQVWGLMEQVVVQDLSRM